MSLLGADSPWVRQFVFDRTENARLADGVDWFVSYPLAIAAIVVIALVVNRLLRRFIKRALQRVLNPPTSRARNAIRRATPGILFTPGEMGSRTEARVATLTTVFRGLSTATVWFFAVIAILAVLRINLAPLLASAGLVGVALGFGAQNIVRDFLAGAFVVVEDQFGVGDIVDLGEAKGTVEQITLRSTRVRDVNGAVWHVPNGQIQRVANKSHLWARALLDVEVDGGTDYARAAEVMQRVGEEVAGDEEWASEVLAAPEVWGIEAFTTEGYTIRLVIKTRPASQFGLMRALRVRLLAEFAASGILLPGDRWVHEDGHGVGL